MGVDSADFDQDGWMDLFVSNIDEEIFSLYRNNHEGVFDDQAMRLGVGMATRWMSGWGVKFIDYDNDGNLDLFLVNGFPDDLVEDFSSRVKYTSLFCSFKIPAAGTRTLANKADLSWQILLRSRMAVATSITMAASTCWWLSTTAPLSFFAIMSANRIIGSGYNWSAQGQSGRYRRTSTYQTGDLTRSHMKIGGGSFLSSHDPRMLLGLGSHPKVDSLEVRWPQPGAAVEHSPIFPPTATSPSSKARVSGNE